MAFLESLSGLPVVGGGVLVTGVVGWMARLLVISDRRTAAEIARINTAHDDELVEVRQARANDIADLKEQVFELRQEVKALRQEIEAERRARHEAEDRAAIAERRAGRD